MNNNPYVFTQKEIEKLPNSFYSHAEAIFHLTEVGIDVKQARVADWLGVSRANVSQVIGRMQNSGLIEMQEELKLSEKGSKTQFSLPVTASKEKSLSFGETLKNFLSTIRELV